MSVTSKSVEPLVKPGAAAVNVTGCEPSDKASATVLTANVTLDAPAGITICAGTVASLVSLLLRATVSAWVAGVFLRKVAVAAVGKPSAAMLRSRVSVSVGPSLSATNNVAVAGVPSGSPPGKEGMGYGDFKLFAAIGAWLGWQMLPLVLMLSAVVGAAVGVFLIVARSHGRNVPISFGPYLAGAGLIAMLWGPLILSRYLTVAGLHPG